MKLRQKLAVVLATAMVATAVPVVTMAASDNGMLREVLKVKKDTEFEERTTAGGIEIKLKDAWQGKEEVFYLSLTDAEWNGKTRTAMVNALCVASNGTYSTTLDGDAAKNTTYLIYGQNIFKYNDDVKDVVVGEILFTEDKVAKVTLYSDSEISANAGVDFEKQDNIVSIPLLVKVTGGDAKVKLEKSGSNSTVTDGEWTFASTAEKKLTFKADDPEVIYETGKLAKVTFTENYAGAFGGGSDSSDVAYIEYEMQNTDYKFDFANHENVIRVYHDVELPGSDDDYTAYELKSGSFFECSYGFSGTDDFKVTAYVKESDEAICVFKIQAPKNFKSDSIGKLALKDIPVRNDEDDIEEEDLLVDISNYGNGTDDLLGNSQDDVKLAKIVSYSTSLTMKDDKAVDIVAGRVEEIEFTLKENIDDSMVGDREIEISLENELAHFNYEKGQTLYSYEINGGEVKSPYGNKGVDDILQDQSEYEWSSSHSGKEKLVQYIKVDDDDNSKLIVKLNPKAQINGEKDKVKIKIKVCVPVANKGNEKVTLKATGRGLEEGKEGVSTTAINIINPFNVTSEEMRVKVGKQDQVGGKVTITEADKAMFMKGKMYLKVVDPATGRTIDGITFYTDKDSDSYVTYETEGDIKKADLDAVSESGTATIKINRQSKSASTLKLSDFHVTVDRTVPEGKYDLVITGDAISEHYYRTSSANSNSAVADEYETEVPVYGYRPVDANAGDYDKDGNYVGKNKGNYEKYVVTYKTVTNSKVDYANDDSAYKYSDDDQAQAHQIVVKDFFVVGTPNTEDITSSGLRRGTSTFVIGENKYVSNGVEYQMDAASYLQDPGFTMIPVRYVAEAFGIESKDIIFSRATATSAGTITILAGERTIQLTNNSDIAVVNGAPIKMDTPVVIKNDRTYAPVGEIARILGIKTSWDGATKTATFINE